MDGEFDKTFDFQFVTETDGSGIVFFFGEYLFRRPVLVFIATIRRNPRVRENIVSADAVDIDIVRVRVIRYNNR